MGFGFDRMVHSIEAADGAMEPAVAGAGVRHLWRPSSTAPSTFGPVDEAGILYAHTLNIRGVDGLPFTGETTGHIVFDQYTYQWIRVDGNSETNIGKESQEAPSC